MSEPTEKESSQAVFPTALGRLPGVGRRTVAAVVRAYPSVDAFEHASESELESALGIRAAHSLRRGMDDGWAGALRRGQEIVDLHASKGIEAIAITDPRYPTLLALTDDPPVVLFVKGDTDLLDAPLSVAVVGTRHPTFRGIETARRLAQRLGDLGVIVISGLAKGIDSAAHEGALDGGRTIAVLGTPIDKVYPAENRGLSEQIAKTGALVSEYAIGAVTRGQAFVERDRIQAGMSIAVIPVQTGLSGGTQHTIKFAQNARRMLLVPRPSDSDDPARENEGIFDLLARGLAKPITALDLPDLLVELARLRDELLTTEALDPSVVPATKAKRGAKSRKLQADTLSWLLPPEPEVPAPVHTMVEVLDELDRTLDRLGPRYDEAAFDAIVRSWRARRFG